MFLLDAVYGGFDKFASWIEKHRSGFFVSSYTHYTARRDHELMSMLKEKGIAVSEDMDEPLRPGSVVFVATPRGRNASRLRHPCLDQEPGRGSAREDGDDALHAHCGQHIVGG